MGTPDYLSFGGDATVLADYALTTTTTTIISGMGKATDFKLGKYIHRVHPNKSSLKIFEKRERGLFIDCPILGGTPYYIAVTGKATDFKFGRYI